jgi:hypothetical protein
MDDNPFNAASQGAEEIDLYGAYLLLSWSGKNVCFPLARQPD